MAEISVIVPVYNSVKYLNRCVDSILSQTFTDFELLLIDDGSSDNSGVICGEYAERDSRVRVFRQENRGQSAARNFGLSQACGEWISFVDSDDVIHNQMLGEMYAAATEYDCKLAACGALESDNILQEFYEPRQAEWEKLNMDENGLVRLEKKGEHRFWTVWGKLINRSIVEKIPFSNGRIYEDNAVAPQWLYAAKSIVNTKEKLYFYQRNPEGTTKSEFSLKHTDYLWALETLLDFFEKEQLSILYSQTCAQYIDAVLNMAVKCRNILHDNQAVQLLECKYKTFKRKNKKYVRISAQNRNRELEAFHPKINRICILVKSSVITLRNGGFQDLSKKVLHYLKILIKQR